MNIGELGIKLIMHFEGLRTEPYQCAAGVWTIGYGRTLCHPSGKQMKGEADREKALALMPSITEEQAIEMLTHDLAKYSKRTEARLHIKLLQHQFDALVSHVYNTGGSDTLFELINTRAKIDAIQAFWTTKYITANGKVLSGLIRRRKAEFELFSTGQLNI